MELKKYCKRCVFYITHSKALNIQKNDFYNHICGYYLNTYINQLGILEYKKYGTLQRCEECGSVIQDPRRIITRRCMEVNKKLKCRAFKPTILWRIPFYISKLIASIKARIAESKRKRKHDNERTI